MNALVLLKNDPRLFLVTHSRVILVMFLAVFSFSAMVPSAHAQTATPDAGDCVDGVNGAGDPCLDINADTLASQIFSGANIIVAALGGIVFLIVGLRFGGSLLRGIGDAIESFRF